MLTIPHALTGLTVAMIVPNPVLGLILAFLSHYLFDFFLPHWNPHLFTQKLKHNRLTKPTVSLILYDGILAGMLTLIIALLKSRNNIFLFVYFICSAFLAILPDFIKIPYYFLNYRPGWLYRYILFERKHQANGNKFWGLLTQIMVVALCLYIQYRL